MQTLNTLLDTVFYNIISPAIIVIRNLLDLIFLTTLSSLHIPLSGQVLIVSICTVLFAFFLRRLLKVDEKNRKFKKQFMAQKEKRDTIKIVEDEKARDAMLQSADQSIDEDFNTYLAQHYFRYVLVYMLPVFLVMAWLNSSLDKTVLPMAEGQTYLFLLPSKPLGMHGVSVTLLFLSSYVLFLIIGFRVKKWYGDKS
ncbi:MAG TPA: hypothetical protein EYG88_09175 [Desulfocapsa sulfexigens]|nr:hypothetical protein [Desulfocapsa sulfexigens]